MLDAIPFEKTIRRVAACVAVLLIGVVLLCPENARAQGGVLRLHILANSDSAEDQRVKLAVRDAVLTMLPACDSATESAAKLETTINRRRQADVTASVIEIASGNLQQGE